jgi:hypothetical protein
MSSDELELSEEEWRLFTADWDETVKMFDAIFADPPEVAGDGEEECVLVPKRDWDRILPLALLGADEVGKKKGEQVERLMEWMKGGRDA